MFGSSRDSISSIYCDYDSHFHSAELYEAIGFKWPDDFDLDSQQISVGKTRFQVIRDLTNGWCYYNHEGNLYPFTKRKILFRDCKLKASVIEERFGKRNPFLASQIWFFEIGFNYGNVEFMIFSYPFEKNMMPVTESHRKVLYRFPLFKLMSEVLQLKEQVEKKSLSLERSKSLENEKIFSNEMLRGWEHGGRDISPSADPYSERLESPLRDYYFKKDNQVSIWLHFEFFES